MCIFSSVSLLYSEVQFTANMSHSVVFLLLISFTLSIESKPLKFFHVSDIHFDPFYNASADEKTRCRYWEGSGTRADYEAPYGRIGCNSPEMLWKIALSGMKEKGCDAEFMMISGTKLELLCKMEIRQQRFQCLFRENDYFPSFSSTCL